MSSTEENGRYRQLDEELSALISTTNLSKVSFNFSKINLRCTNVFELTSYFEHLM